MKMRFLGLAMGVLLVGSADVHAVILTAPTVTDCSPVHGGFPGTNAVDGTAADYASYYQGTNTFLELDFGSSVTFDRVIMLNRNSPSPADLYSQVKLTYDSGSDTIDANPNRGRGDVSPVGGAAGVTTQTVRWDVITGGVNNVGLTEVYFLNTPTGTEVMSGVSVIASAPPFGAAFAAANAIDGSLAYDSGSSANYNEYASMSHGANMYIDFDLGAVKPVGGFDYFDRFSPTDQVSGYNLIFSNVSDFSSAVATKSYSKSTVAQSDVFDPVMARYVRLDATAAGSAANTGANEVIFYETPLPGEVVTPVAAYATAQFNTSAASRMIDGSGLDVDGAGGLHDNSGGAFTMWTAGPLDGGLGGPYGSPPVVADQEVVFDLGEVQELSGALVWNHNQANLTGRGIDEMEILLSLDSDPLTASFTSLGTYFLTEANGVSEGAQWLSFAGTARLVKFDIQSVHSGLTSDYVGLSEVRFVGAIPEPSSTVLVLVSCLGLSLVATRRTRKGCQVPLQQESLF